MHYRLLFLIPFLMIAIPVNADMNLKPVHPDESVEFTYNERFSTKNALRRLEQIQSALKSFKELTTAAQKKLPKKTLQKVGNTGMETQNLGFNNWPASIEGTLYKNEYIIKKLQYELLKEKAKSGKPKSIDLKAAEKELKLSEQQFRKFWKSFGVSD